MTTRRARDIDPALLLGMPCAELADWQHAHGRRLADHDHDWVTFTSSDGRRLTRRCSRCATEWDSPRGAK